MQNCDAFIEVYVLPTYGTYVGGYCALYRFVPVGTTVTSFNRQPDYLFRVRVHDVKLLSLDYPVHWYIGCWPGQSVNDSFL